jgi:16S rRNA (guanine527-N7)-methyltransferase
MSHPAPAIESRLDQGFAELGLSLGSGQRERLLGLLALLQKWNRAYNLTAIRRADEMVSRHLLDSAAVLPHVTGPRVLDVGSGPGLPGLVLAILAPGLSVTLLDSNGKKVRFQRQAVLELGLDNVTPLQARVETLTGEFDQVVSRAFAALGDFVTLSEALVVSGGQWLAMKGPAAEDELARLPAGIVPVARHPLRVPFEAGHRQLVVLERQGSTPGRR